MKRFLTIFALFVVAIAGCDQQKSGPVAESPQDGEPEAKTTQEAPPSEPKPTPKTDALYESAGPDQPVTVAESTEVKLQIRPAEGFKINKRFSWKFDFESNDGVDVETASVGKDAIELEESGASIPVKIKAKTAGDHRLVATADFSVCNDSKCELYRDESVTFEIAAADAN